MSENVLKFTFLGDNKFSGPAKEVERSTDSLGSKIGKFGTFAGKALIGVGTAMGGMAVAGTVLGVKTAASLEQAQIGFATLLHSGQKAQVFLSGLTKFAAATPFELKGLIDSSRTLIGVGVSAKGAMGMLQDFGDAASAVGIGQDSFQRIMLATSQAISAGKFMTADLNQIANNGIPVWVILSKAMHKTVPELRDLASHGQLLSKDVLPTLQREMHKDYGGAMAKQSMTLNGLWSTFTDTLSLGLAKAITPMIPALKTGLAGASVVAGKALQKLPGILDTVTGAIKGVVQIVKGAGPLFSGLWKGLSDALPHIDLSDFGKSLETQAKHWGGRISGGIASGIHFGDWKPLVGVASDALTGGFTDIGNKLDSKVKGWPGRLLGSLQLGFAGGGWGPLGTTIGDGLSNAITAGASGAGRLAVAIGKWIGGVDWEVIGENVGKTAFPFIVGFTATFFDGIFTAAKQHPLNTALLILAFIPLGKLASAFGPLRTAIEALPLGKWITGALDHSAAPVFDAIWTFMKFFGRKFMEGLGFESVEVGGAVRGFVRGIGDEIGLRAMYLADRATEFIGGIPKGIGMGIRGAVKAGAQVIVDLIRPWADAGKWLIVRGREVVDGAIGGITARFGRVSSAMGNTISRVVSPFARAGRWLAGKGSDVVEGLYGGIRNRFTSLGNAMEMTIYHIEHPFHSAGTWLYQAGREVLRSLRDGMVNGVQAAGSWAASIGGKIVRAVKGYFGIHSPSKVFGAIGTNLIRSLFGSMIDHNPVQTVKRIFGGMPQALGAIVDKGMVHIASLPGRAMSALSGLGGKFAGLFGGGGAGGIRIGGTSAAEAWIISHESGGRTNAQNPTSTAFGLGQLLIANRQHYGAILGVSPNTTNAGAQLSMMRMYIRDRYGNAENAQRFWQSHGWYGGGGVVSKPTLIGAGERGPERVLSAGQTASFEKLVRVLDRGWAGSSQPANSSADAIDYRKLGDHVAAAFTRAGITVQMDGKALGRVLGSSASILGRTG